jgi:hypothetical protein
MVHCTATPQIDCVALHLVSPCINLLTAALARAVAAVAVTGPNESKWPDRLALLIRFRPFINAILLESAKTSTRPKYGN